MFNNVVFTCFMCLYKIKRTVYDILQLLTSHLIISLSYLFLCTGSITPTVELNGLAMKRGEPAIYRPLDPKPMPNYRANYNFRGMFNQRWALKTKLMLLPLTVDLPKSTSLHWLIRSTVKGYSQSLIDSDSLCMGFCYFQASQASCCILKTNLSLLFYKSRQSYK